MKVIAAEYGVRPIVWTKARRFAPQGLRVLADLLERFEFADIAACVLDWSNVLQRQPDEAAKPVLIVQTVKFVDDKNLEVEVRIDVDDVFGGDEIDADNLVDIVHQLEQKTLTEMERYNGLQRN